SQHDISQFHLMLMYLSIMAQAPYIMLALGMNTIRKILRRADRANPVCKAFSRLGMVGYSFVAAALLTPTVVNLLIQHTAIQYGDIAWWGMFWGTTLGASINLLVAIGIGFIYWLFTSEAGYKEYTYLPERRLEAGSLFWPFLKAREAEPLHVAFGMICLLL